MNVTPNWKPLPRRVDPEARERFRAEHPRCCLARPGINDCYYATGQVEVHHMDEKGDGGGDDVAACLLSLCTAHHTGWSGTKGWHTFGDPREFVAHYEARFAPADLFRVVMLLSLTRVEREAVRQIWRAAI